MKKFPKKVDQPIRIDEAKIIRDYGIIDLMRTTFNSIPFYRYNINTNPSSTSEIYAKYRGQKLPDGKRDYCSICDCTYGGYVGDFLNHRIKYHHMATRQAYKELEELLKK